MRGFVTVFGYPRRSALPWQRFAVAVTAHKTAHPASGENVRSQRLTMGRPESTCRADVTCLIFTQSTTWRPRSACIARPA